MPTKTLGRDGPAGAAAAATLVLGESSMTEFRSCECGLATFAQPPSPWRRRCDDGRPKRLFGLRVNGPSWIKLHRGLGRPSGERSRGGRCVGAGERSEPAPTQREYCTCSDGSWNIQAGFGAGPNRPEFNVVSAALRGCGRSLSLLPL